MTGMCPHCGDIVAVVNTLTVDHDGCPGSQQIPRCAESDARPLWNGEPNPHFRAYANEYERRLDDAYFLQEGRE